MKTFWESTGITPHADIGSKWWWVVSSTPWLLQARGKTDRYSL